MLLRRTRVRQRLGRRASSERDARVSAYNPTECRCETRRKAYSLSLQTRKPLTRKTLRTTKILVFDRLSRAKSSGQMSADESGQTDREGKQQTGRKERTHCKTGSRLCAGSLTICLVVFLCGSLTEDLNS